jgi:hypothetical protein
MAIHRHNSNTPSVVPGVCSVIPFSRQHGVLHPSRACLFGTLVPRLLLYLCVCVCVRIQRVQVSGHGGGCCSCPPAACMPARKLQVGSLSSPCFDGIHQCSANVVRCILYGFNAASVCCSLCS